MTTTTRQPSSASWRARTARSSARTPSYGAHGACPRTQPSAGWSKFGGASAVGCSFDHGRNNRKYRGCSAAAASRYGPKSAGTSPGVISDGLDSLSPVTSPRHSADADAETPSDASATRIPTSSRRLTRTFQHPPPGQRLGGGPAVVFLSPRTPGDQRSASPSAAGPAPSSAHPAG